MMIGRAGPRRSTMCRYFWNATSFSSRVSSSGPVICVPSGSTSTRDSAARRSSQRSISRSSRMKNSLRPRLARKSGGCAM